MNRSDPRTVYDRLEQLGIAYRSVTHPPAYGMDDLHDITQALGAPFFKNLFLRNRQGTAYYLLMVEGSKRFRTAEVSKKLGTARLSFGDDQALYELLGVTAGAVGPLGLIFDPGHRVTVVIDRDLLSIPRLCAHACVNTESVVLDTGDILGTYIAHCGHRPIYLDITGEADPPA